MGLLEKIFGSYSSKELKRIDPIVKSVLALEDKYTAMSEEELKGMTAVLKERLEDGETLDDILPDAFATCREATWRVLGKKQFPVQVIGGIVLHQGRIAEMKTGEGKTFVVPLAAYLNALTGKGVHVVTVNEYLAKFHSEMIGKVYRYLGLTVGLIIHEMTNEERRAAYNADITYGTNNEIGFDYLRDNMVIYKENRVQRPFNFAIVDEVDSILIDEARTPLIISGPGDKSTDLYTQADRFVCQLKMTKVKELDDKEDNDQIEGDYLVDEKARTATLTKAGIKKAEEYFHIDNLTDAENITLQHHINQAIRAHGVMTRDVDYVVKDGEVIIVDEFTGRLMIGRRYNEGLHQAIEAKEHVTVEKESKTLATITFQNLFRLYKKLSGTTGTALTEEDEFREIYKLDVIAIPTNKLVIRLDQPDVIYKTEQAKYNAVIEQIIKCHEKGQPVLVGTVSIDKSELLSKMLKRRGIKHEVLNAKYHEKEAEIIAQAGHLGAVTIATNMAGRGTDILLGGNEEFLARAEMRKMGYFEERINDATSYFETEDEEILKARKVYQELLEKHKKQIELDAEKVKEAGGLYVLGTERHESRRIDNQLRGRAGRQGDPGESRFFLSLEDDLLRLFGGERINLLMDTLKVDDDMPIESKMLSSTIESAQKKVEGRNFSTRKSVLKFDDVMNKQREIIYKQRSQVLDGEDLKDVISKMINEFIAETVDTYLTDTDIHDNWNLDGLHDYFLGWLISDDELRYQGEELANADKEQIKKELQDKAAKLYAEREKKFTPNVMRELERVILLKVVDTKWMDHIDNMEELKRGIYLRSYAQHDPVQEYAKEGFDMFEELIHSIKEDTCKLMLTIQIRTNQEPQREQVAKPTTASHGGDDSGKTVKKEPRHVKKVGRNDPCPCGSGKKYKKCCGRNE